MRGASRHLLAATAALWLLALPAAAPGATVPDPDRYELAGGCYALRSQALGGALVAEQRDGYRADAAKAADAARFRMQATDLGSYLLYGADGDFLALGDGGEIEAARRPGQAAIWEVEEATGGGFTLRSETNGAALAGRAGGELSTGGTGDGAKFEFEPATACRAFPEIETSATGKPLRGKTPYGEVRGLWDPHMHMMAFEFLGGGLHCGRPWHPLGVAEALPDCAESEGPQGAAAPVQNFLNWGSPAFPHDTRGWPTFNDWPNHHSLTYEQTYYKWLERAWLGGMRIVVNLFVENRAFCETLALSTPRRNPCDEMDSVRLQAQRINEFQDYIDAQAGGPGKGFFRIVRNPFQARRVVNKGKLAVVLGIEVSELFGCRMANGVPQCDQADIDRQLDEFHDVGVRDLELLNKFDSALVGVRYDSGAIGPVVNAGNFYTTGRFWKAETCTGPEHDNTIEPAPAATDPLFDTGLDEVLPFGSVPVYPSPPHCNVYGMTPLGEYLVRRMIEKNMIIDPDHMSALGVDRALALADEANYSGVVSSHSWMDEQNWPDIYDLGGVVGPKAGGSESFVETWRETRRMRSPKHYFGFGFGDDMNGFASQGAPREGASNPVQYPFKSFDGGVTFERQRSGERVFDINVDGVAHFGLYPDWVEDLRMQAGKRIVRDLSRGAEAYLQMWERANGVPRRRCRPAKGGLTRKGLGRIELGDSAKRVLQRAGQPHRRPGRAYRYCVRDRKRKAKVVAVFTGRGKVGLVATTARRQIRRSGDGPRFADGKRFAAVASPGIAGSERKLKRYLRLAKVR
ncbi:MAG: hypothetical protein ACRDK9_05770 [Solirubrobacterales bacterium]